MVGWLFALLSYHSWVLFSSLTVTYVLYLNMFWDCVQAVFVDSLQEKEYNFLIQAVRKTLRGVGGTAAPLTLNCIQRDRALILLAKSIPDQFGRLLVG